MLSLSFPLDVELCNYVNTTLMAAEENKFHNKNSSQVTMMEEICSVQSDDCSYYDIMIKHTCMSHLFVLHVFIVP